MDIARAHIPTGSRRRQQSAKTNGNKLLIDGDGRSLWARRWKDIQNIFISDLGGIERLTEYQRGLIGAAATLQCQLEKMQCDISRGKEVDPKELARLVGTYKRTCTELGLVAKSQKNTPGGLGDLLAADIDRQREARK